MEPERSGSKIGDRPVTRWRRDQDDGSRPQSRVERPSTSIGRPHSKIERPTSRRGIKDDTSEYSGTGSYRSATPARSALARPPTGSVFSGRIPSATSRLSTMHSAAGLGRLNTGLPMTSQMNMNILDRPITQHGIAAVRPGSTKGWPLTRQVQDKRYYEGLLQLKIRELTQEITAITRTIDIQNKERATFLHYDKRAKDLAAELTALQGQLAEYNIIVDKMTSDTDKETIEQDVKELARVNESLLAEIEYMFEQRQQMEQKLRQLEREVEKERKSNERLIESMDAATKEKYDALIQEKIELQESIDKMQQEFDELSKEQLRLEEQIALSQLKQEAVKLHVNIMETEERRDKLKAEEENRMSPETERENLLQKVKQDNMDIAAAEAQISEKKKRMAEIEQELEQLEVDLEDSPTDKKYKEFRKREEIIEQFMSNFEQNKKEELDKLEKLEKNIVQQLAQISNEVDTDSSLAGEELTILSNHSLYENYEKMNHDRSLEGLSKEHMKLQLTLSRMESLEQRLRTEFNELSEKTNRKQSELITLEDLDGLKAQSEMKREKLTAEYEQLQSEYPKSEQELKAIQEEYADIKERLDKNDTYVQINALEKKLEKLRQDSKQLQDFITEQKDRGNYLPLKERAFQLVEQYNTILKENLKPIY